MQTIDLDGRTFSPVRNSEAGRVSSDAVFRFQQSGAAFTAQYSGEGFSDGHLIGCMTASDKADLIYHCRAADGGLEAGEAKADFSVDDDGNITIDMSWRWLNGSLAN